MGIEDARWQAKNGVKVCHLEQILADRLTGSPLEQDVVGHKRVQFDEETWQALDLLARDQIKTFQELADEAFGDLLKKNNRPVNLKEALRKSAGHSASVHQLHPGKKKHAKR